MADVTVKYKSATILEMNAQGTRTLKTSGKYCEGDISVAYVPRTGKSDVSGTLGESNNVLLEGNLANGTYTFKYKNVNGTYDTIGTYVVDNNIYYSVTKTLTNCDISNNATQVIGGTRYYAVITAHSGYELSSVTVTMGGSPITVTNGIIDVTVTGAIEITAVAEEIKPAYNNLAKPNDTNKTWSGDWVNDARMGSNGAYRSSTNSMVTNTIALNKGDVLYFANTGFTSTGNGVTNGYQIAFFKESNATTIWYGGTPEGIAASYPITFTYNADGTLASMAFNATDKETAYMRLCLAKTVDKYKVIIAKKPII